MLITFILVIVKNEVPTNYIESLSTSFSSLKTRKDGTLQATMLRHQQQHRSLKKKKNTNSTVPVSAQKTIFYAMGDIPYKSSEYTVFAQRIKELPSDAAFLIHVGDIRSGKNPAPCSTNDYTSAAKVLKKSRVPVFIIRKFTLYMGAMTNKFFSIFIDPLSVSHYLIIIIC
jgi:hypothetical protein